MNEAELRSFHELRASALNIAASLSRLRAVDATRLPRKELLAHNNLLIATAQKLAEQIARLIEYLC